MTGTNNIEHNCHLYTFDIAWIYHKATHILLTYLLVVEYLISALFSEEFIM